MTPAGLRSVVIARPDRIGDVVLSSSCLEPVRAALPDARLHWLVQSPLQPLFRQHPLLASVISPVGGSLWTRVVGLAAHFRELQPDAIALLQPDRTVELAAWRAGIPIRAGFSRPRCWPQFLTHAVPYRKSSGDRSEAAINFDVLGLLGVPTPATLRASLAPDPAGHERLLGKLGPAVARRRQTAVFHLAAHGQKLRVPLPVLAGLAGWLRRTHGLAPVLIGSETEPFLAEFANLAAVEPSDVIDLRSKTDLSETAALFEQAALCVARDSGPAHLAAAVGCPTLALFPDVRPIAGPTRWTPLGCRVEVVTVTGSGFSAEALQISASKLLGGGKS
jgi:ADP-heptose:LPS heptosyltransferase